jgi:hypothetical protein
MAVSVALADGEMDAEMVREVVGLGFVQPPPPRREGSGIEDADMLGETERVGIGVRDGSSPHGTSGQVDHGGLPMVNKTDIEQCPLVIAEESASVYRTGSPC